jgi:hypothetical protein
MEKNIFDDFVINSYINEPPPSDSSFTTMQEIKALAKIPIDKKFVEENDPVDEVFASIIGNYDPLIPIIAQSSRTPIMKIKNHHNRPRPKMIADKFGIKLDYHFMPSMNTPSYPSGHSAQAQVLAQVLSDKYPHLRDKLQRASRLVSYSRNVAHEHYKSDSTFGIKIGDDMYDYLKEKQII